MKNQMVPGIKVDKGLVQLPGTEEKSNQGLDGLPERLSSLASLGKYNKA